MKFIGRIIRRAPTSCSPSFPVRRSQRLAEASQVIVQQGDGWVPRLRSGNRATSFGSSTSIQSQFVLRSVAAPRESRSSRTRLIYEIACYHRGTGRVQAKGPDGSSASTNESAATSARVGSRCRQQPVPAAALAALNPQAGRRKVIHTTRISGLDWEFTSCGKQFEDAMLRTMSSVAIANGW